MKFDLLLRNVSDTARAVALSRAIETERPDALFRDPYAWRLVGPRWERFRPLLKVLNPNSWGLPLRTVLLDAIVLRAVRGGVDTVVNLAAGLDARPYRMGELPASLRWIEVDLPGILDEKEEVLVGDKPVCQLERVRLDLADASRRRALFERLGQESKRALVLTEGLLMYLRPADVEGLARDLASQPCFQLWGTDLASSGMIRLTNAVFGWAFARANARFYPLAAEAGPLFESWGWRFVEGYSVIHEAARIGRLGLSARPMAWLPKPHRPDEVSWYGIHLLERIP